MVPYVLCRFVIIYFFFQAEDGIRDLVRSRGLGDVYKRQGQGPPGRRHHRAGLRDRATRVRRPSPAGADERGGRSSGPPCLLYTSDAADERSSVDLGGRRIIKKNTHTHNTHTHTPLALTYQ